MQELTLTETKALLFAPDAIVEQPRTLYRVDGGDLRYYVTRDDMGNMEECFVSVTTLLSQMMPTSPFLIDWIKRLGDQSAVIRDQKASYGTLFHILAGRLLIDRRMCLDYDYLDYEVYAWCQNHQQEQVPLGNARLAALKLQKDLLALAQWIKDWKIQPLAIEVVLSHPSGYAGAIDLVCWMANPKNPEHRFRAIVDFKTGAMYDSHVCQLAMYRRMWNLAYGNDLFVVEMYNWSPKDWTGKAPTYVFKEQTEEEVLIQATDYYVELWAILGQKQPKPARVISGTIDLDTEQDLTELFTTVQFEQTVYGESEEVVNE